jgi:aryl-alcohol dehydrogenase-like predicted oxidoreductase
LGIETLDVFYIHNPESQLADVSREVFYDRLKHAFEMLEKQVTAGTLAYYGVATWNGFRVAEAARDYLNLFDLAQLAREAGGQEHHFRFLQLPFNLAMAEAYGLINQRSGKERLPLLSAASQLGIAVMGSATLYQGNLTSGLPPVVGRILGLKSDAENAIQFSRSAPGIATSLIGMGQAAHVQANLKLALVPPTSPEEWKRLFRER